MSFYHQYILNIRLMVAAYQTYMSDTPNTTQTPKYPDIQCSHLTDILLISYSSVTYSQTLAYFSGIPHIYML